ncbi:NAD-dependent deacylase [Ectobacillus polymachus]|uniref:NAD-dependent deacylase n=1 Tax=Ectobacillus polymachus TaxID=1508806 RepID=UPI003A87E65B
MLASILEHAKYPVVLTGAGMSTESGLPDFRSSQNGLWKNRDPLELASVHAMQHNRSNFISFYRSRMNALREIIPHKGYDILANWVQRGKVKAIITQNVDGLHSISGVHNVAELHGTLRTCHCHTCGKKYPSEVFLESDDLQCSCGGFIRPSVVLFGESLSEEPLHFAERESQKADLFLVLGTSLQVTPANLFPQIAKRNGASLVIVNRESTPLDPIADLVIHDQNIGDVLYEADEKLGY